MEYVKLGHTGLEISPICLGCMSYSQGPTQKHGWLFTEEESRPFLKHALDLGINFFDTANAYAGGASEETLGNTLLRYAPREDVVITTKVQSRMRPGANGEGLSRKAIMTEIDASLKRMKTDYVDIYMIHHWDPTSPLEETLEALHDVVKAGKALYLAGSGMHAWQLGKAIQIQRAHGWARFIAIQNHMNLLYREEEREMLPLCRDQGVGALPWSPLARGRLTRARNQTSHRSQTDGYTSKLYPTETDADIEIVERVLALAETHSVRPAQVALAWLLSKEPVVAPVMGATRLEHLTDAVGACSLRLAPEEIRHLEEPYKPLPLLGAA